MSNAQIINIPQKCEHKHDIIPQKGGSDTDVTISSADDMDVTRKVSSAHATIKSVLNNLVWSVEAAVDGGEVDATVERDEAEKALATIKQLVLDEVIGIGGNAPIVSWDSYEDLRKKQRQALGKVMGGE